MNDLGRLGVDEGDIVLVHASLRSCGYVVGGAGALVGALLDAVGPKGTIVVPTPTPDNSDPSRWHLTTKQPVPPQWWPEIRNHLPAFDPASTPSCNVGVIPETVRGWPGAIRSNHPQSSFAALGFEAAQLMAVHERDCHLGEASPLGSLFRANAKILLLGVDYDVCTAFHLAQYRLPDTPERDYECVIVEDGRRRWYHYRDVPLSDTDFAAVGRALEASTADQPMIRSGPVGDSRSRLLPLTTAVDFAVQWFLQHHR